MKKYIGWMTGCTAAALITMTGCSTNENMESTLAARPAMRAGFMPVQAAVGLFVPHNGTVSCCGSYKGFANVTNSDTGTVWFTPPAGTTNCVATDASGLASPYVSVVKALRKDFASWCGTNSVSFPVSSSKQYKFIIYIKNTPPPPTNGAPLTLDIQWQ